jgi:hypothetical protein
MPRTNTGEVCLFAAPRGAPQHATRPDAVTAHGAIETSICTTGSPLRGGAAVAGGDALPAALAIPPLAALAVPPPAALAVPPPAALAIPPPAALAVPLPAALAIPLPAAPAIALPVAPVLVAAPPVHAVIATTNPAYARPIPSFSHDRSEPPREPRR